VRFVFVETRDLFADISKMVLHIPLFETSKLALAPQAVRGQKRRK
jgi:hypothetical protein